MIRICCIILLLLLAGCAAHPLSVVHTGNMAVKVVADPHAEPISQWPIPTRLDGFGPGHVAIIDIDGLLLNAPAIGLGSKGENPVSLLREKLDAADNDCDVRAIVLRINSPGGGVTAADIMRRDVIDFKTRTGLPVVACLMDTGTGGAYYVATAADAILAHPTSIVGGIGVIFNVYSLEDTMLQFEVSAVPVKAGEHIDLGSPIRTMTQEGREILEAIAVELHQRFVNTVRDRREINDAEVAEISDGRIMTARTALDRKLIDGIGYLDDAIAWAAELCGADVSHAVLLKRADQRPASIYEVTPNVPLDRTVLPISIPGLERSRLPMFLYLWQADPTLERTLGP